MMKIKAVILCAAAILACRPARVGAEEPIFQAMQSEMERSMKRLKFEDFKPPYFLSYQIMETSDAIVNVRYGALVQNQSGGNRALYVELRYGNYDGDNTDENYRGVLDSASLEGDSADLRHRLWLATDQAYKQAVKDYLQKQGKKVSTLEKEKVPDFSREKPQRAVVEPDPDPGELDDYVGILKSASGSFKRTREILDSGITLRRIRKTFYCLNSEGTRLLTPGSGNPYFIYLWARTQADDGMNLDGYRTFSAHTRKSLPDEPELEKAVAELTRQLLALKGAKPADPYTAPAILDPESTGVLFHEALGHRVEGERQRDDEEGQTFKGQVGKAIIPEFLTVEDDPTLRLWKGVELNGFYHYDEEGVPAQKAVIADRGILRNYLLSRRPISGFSKSNGHGRAQFGRDPIGRMSNLFVKSSREVSAEDLKKMLIEECKKQNKPYGLLIRRIRSGDTSTGRGRYQAFRGTPEEVFWVNAETGEETLVRGVELVGTPLITINKIIATGDDAMAVNAFCGAESGTVPVSTIAPSCLVKEVELQRKREDKQRPPILPPPLFDGAQGPQ